MIETKEIPTFAEITSSQIDFMNNSNVGYSMKGGCYTGYPPFWPLSATNITLAQQIFYFLHCQILKNCKNRFGLNSHG